MDQESPMTPAELREIVVRLGGLRPSARLAGSTHTSLRRYLAGVTVPARVANALRAAVAGQIAVAP